MRGACQAWLPRRRIARVLTAAVSGRRPRARLRRDDGSALVEAATTHRVAGSVERALRETAPSAGGGIRCMAGRHGTFWSMVPALGFEL